MGTLKIGDSGSTYYPCTLAASGGASLTLNNNGNGASLVQAITAASDVISAPLTLADNLFITNDSTLRLSGIISDGGAGKTITVSNTTRYLQLNGVNTYSGGTILSGLSYVSLGNNRALGTGQITVGGTPGDGQVWFQSGGNLTLTNTFEIRTIRWIIDWNTANGVAAGNLTVNGNVLLNTGSSNVRDIYCGMNLTLNGNITVTPTNNPFNKQGGSTLTLTEISWMGAGFHFFRPPV